MQVTRCQYYSIPVEDKPGEVLRFTLKLRDAGANLEGLWGFGVGDGRAEIYAVPSDGARLEAALVTGGYQGKLGTCFRLIAEDRVGALCEALDKIESLGINLRAVDAIGISGQCGAFFWVDPADEDRAAKAFDL